MSDIMFLIIVSGFWQRAKESIHPRALKGNLQNFVVSRNLGKTCHSNLTMLGRTSLKFPLVLDGTIHYSTVDRFPFLLPKAYSQTHHAIWFSISNHSKAEQTITEDRFVIQVFLS